MAIVIIVIAVRDAVIALKMMTLKRMMMRMSRICLGFQTLRQRFN
jgi:hypothetical protein